MTLRRRHRLAVDPPSQAKEEHPDATEDAGPWLFTLDFPSYMPIMTHATNRRAAIMDPCEACIWPHAHHMFLLQLSAWRAEEQQSQNIGECSCAAASRRGIELEQSPQT